MDVAAVKAFLDVSSKVDKTLGTLSPSFLSVKREEGDLVLFQGKERTGVLSPRAERNLARITRINHGLIATLPEVTLNEAIRFQLASNETIGTLRHPDNVEQIISLVEEPHTYLKYADVISDVPLEDLVFLHGNVVEDDKISFLRGGVKHTPRDGRELIVGLFVSVSSTNNTVSKLSYGCFRGFCQNSLIDNCFMDRTLKSLDIRLMRAAFTEFMRSMDIYTGNLTKIILKSDSIKPDKRNLDEYLSLVRFPQTLVNSFKDTINNEGQNTDQVLRAAGVDGKDTLWQWANIMSSLVKDLPSLSQRESSEKAIFTWMSSFYKVLNN